MNRTNSFVMMMMVVLATGCPSEQQEPPEIMDTETGGPNTTGPSTSSPTTSATTMPTSTTNAETGTETGNESESGNETGVDECVGADGCWDCEPMEPAQVLNHCTDATCEAFPNTSERLPLLKEDGSLPAIP